MASKNIMVVGGYGHVGQVVSSTLGKRFSGRVLAAGRDFERAEAISLKTDRRVLPSQLDLADPRQAETSLDEARVVVMCVDQEDTGFVEACIDRGIHYIDVTASYAFLSQVERLDALAKRRGATGVLSVGLAPGLTNLLAKHAKDVLGAVRNLDIYVMLGLAEAHGKAAIRWTVENLDKQFAIRRSGASKIVGSFEGPKQTVFPNRYGRRTAYLFDFADQHAVARTLALENVATRLCFDSAAMTWLLASLKRARLFGMLARFGLQDALTALFARVRTGSDEFVVKVDAEGERHGSRHAYSCSISGRQEGYVTGLVAALIAERLYNSDVEHGVFHIEQLFDPLTIFRELADQGLIIDLDSVRAM